MLRAVLLVSVLCMPMLACAQAVYKCPDGHGGTEYRQTPCAGSGGQVVDATPAATTSAAEQRSAQARATRDINAANTLRAHEEAAYQRRMAAARTSANQASAQQAVRDAASRGYVGKGMSATDVLQSWGKPSHINNNAGTEQWVYPNGRTFDSTYVYVRNGVVVDVAEYCSDRDGVSTCAKRKIAQ